MQKNTIKSLKLSAPGKLILCGEHSVTYGKKALASAIDLRTNLTAYYRKEDDDVEDSFNLDLPNINRCVRLTSADFSTHSSSILSRDEALSRYQNETNNGDKHLEAVKFMIRTVPQLTWSHLKRLQVEIRSELPLASGLGSSASFSVCLSALFLLLAKPTSSTLDLDAVNSYAFSLEHIFHGRPSGIDNSVACYGNYVVFERGSIVDKFSAADSLPILVVNSCVPKQTSEQVSKVRELHSRHPNIVDSLMNSIGDIVDEFVRVLKSSSSNQNDSKTSLNDLITLNHGILHSLQVDRLELATIVGLADKYNFHAKITGSGGGGCCFVMLSDADENNKTQLIDELNKFDFVSFPTKLGCKGITIENIEF